MLQEPIEPYEKYLEQEDEQEFFISPLEAKKLDTKNNDDNNNNNNNKTQAELLKRIQELEEQLAR